MSTRTPDQSVAPDGRTAMQSLQSALPGRRSSLAAGNTAVYPGQGPCRIGRVVNKVVDGRAMMFYHLTVLDDRRAELFVPVEKALAKTGRTSSYGITPTRPINSGGFADSRSFVGIV